MNTTTVLAYLDVIGLILGFFGGILTCIFGLPNRAVLNEGAYVETRETPRMRRFNRFSRTGLAMVSAGFAMQLAQAVYALIH
jgi:hypothetical protein